YPSLSRSWAVPGTVLLPRRRVGDARRDRIASHQVVDARALLLEIGELFAAELPFARHLDRHRVDEAVVDEHLEVHVRSRGQTRGADIADDLPLPHLHALADARRQARHMPIGRLVAVGMTNADVVAVLALAPGFFDDAAAGRHDRRAGGAGPVDAGVHLGNLQDRVPADAEARGDPHVLAAHGAAHQELARGVALLIVVVDQPLRAPKAIEPVRFSAGGHRGGKQIAEAAVHGLVFVFHIKEELETVTGAHPLAKIGL